MLGQQAEQTECDVVHDCAELCGRCLDVQAPAAVVVLMVEQILDHLVALGLRPLLQHARHIAHDQRARQQKHRTAIVARPMPVVILQVREVVDGGHVGLHTVCRERRGGEGGQVELVVSVGGQSEWFVVCECLSAIDFVARVLVLLVVRDGGLCCAHDVLPHLTAALADQLPSHVRHGGPREMEGGSRRITASGGLYGWSELI